MSGHTPGPWAVAMVGESHARIDAADRDVTVAVMDCEPGDGEARTVLRADAALVAAAPELLAALERLAEYETDGERYRFAIRPDDMAALRAAIAKARGAK